MKEEDEFAVGSTKGFGAEGFKSRRFEPIPLCQNVVDLERDVVNAGPLLGQILSDDRFVVRGMEKLEVGFADLKVIGDKSLAGNLLDLVEPKSQCISKGRERTVGVEDGDSNVVDFLNQCFLRRVTHVVESILAVSTNDLAQFLPRFHGLTRFGG